MNANVQFPWQDFGQLHCRQGEEHHNHFLVALLVHRCCLQRGLQRESCRIPKHCFALVHRLSSCQHSVPSAWQGFCPQVAAVLIGWMAWGFADSSIPPQWQEAAQALSDIASTKPHHVHCQNRVINIVELYLVCLTMLDQMSDI